jgi:hypothetical protein
MPRVRTTPQRHQPKTTPSGQLPIPLADGTVALAMIQSLIPLGRKAVEEALQREVTALAGRWYSRTDGAHRR